MQKSRFDRRLVDVGNVLAMEHVNVTVPDQSLATLFYVNGLGFTRDPYIDFGPFNVWINVGRQQFHLPTAAPQVLRGRIGVVVPDLKALGDRLQTVKRRLADTDFRYVERQHFTDVTCPWGNSIRCHGPGSHGQMQLGIPYVEFSVPKGTARGISRFYTEIMQCPSQVKTSGKGKPACCEVSIGTGQQLRFREVGKPEPLYDGHHIAIYVADFSGPHKLLQKAGLITEESDENQYRFQTIIDPSNGRELFEIEHEVRSLYHPMHERYLVNRNPDQNFFNYRKELDAFRPG